MSKKKAQLNDSISNRDSDSECIVLGSDRSTCESPRAVRSPSTFFVIDKKAKEGPSVHQEANVVENFYTEPFFYDHQLQYNGDFENAIPNAWN